MFEQILSYVVALVGLIGIWLTLNGIRNSIYISLFVQILWFWFGWVSGYPAFMLSALVYAAIYAKKLADRHAAEKAYPHRFTKRPVPIEAIQLLDIDHTDQELILGVRGGGRTTQAPAWFKDALINDRMWVQEDKANKTYILKVATLEDPMTASIGDWIIRGVEGELYPCKPHIFEKTYE